MGGKINDAQQEYILLCFVRHLEMALHAIFRTGSIFEACDDLLQAGDAYSAEEKKHRVRAMVRIVLASVPQLLVFASFLGMLFLAPVFCFALSNVVFVYVGEGAVSSDSYRYRLAYESIQVVYHAIQHSVLAEHLGFSDGRCCLSEFSLD